MSKAMHFYREADAAQLAVGLYQLAVVIDAQLADTARASALKFPAQQRDRATLACDYGTGRLAARAALPPGASTTINDRRTTSGRLAVWSVDRCATPQERGCGFVGATIEPDIARNNWRSFSCLQRFAHAVRDHWGAENRLHWRLDVVFGEDASRIRKGNAPAIMNSIRHLCMNLFELEPSSLHLSKKRRKAAWNDDYRAPKVVFG